IETVQINGIGTVNRDATALDEPGDGIDQSKILILVITTKGGWKNHERKSAARAKSQHLEIAAQMGRPPSDVTLLHGEEGDRKASIIRRGGAAKRETRPSAVDNAILFADSSRSQNAKAHSHREYSPSCAIRIAYSEKSTRCSGLSSARLSPFDCEALSGPLLAGRPKSF